MRARWSVVGVLGVATVACSAVLGLDPPPAVDGGASGEPDSTAPGDDSSPGDGGPGIDTGVVMCTPLDGGTGGSYLPLTVGIPIDDAGDTNWQTFNAAALPNFGSAGFTGATFDGRYIYVAGLGTRVGRFDTHGQFDDPNAWTVYDPSPAAGFAGAVFDGRYVYFVPGTRGTPQSIAARYDTLGSFASSGSWTTFDFSVLSDGGALAAGFFGSAFDGHAVYFVPHNDGTPDGRVLRYDTTASADAAPPVVEAGPSPVDGGLDAAVDAASDSGVDGGTEAGSTFGDLASWTTFDTTTVNPLARGFAGGIVAAGALYLVPETDDAYDAAIHGGNDGVVARHTLDGGLATASTWSTFDMTLVNGLADGFVGAVFDTQYVYFVPRDNGIVMRVDTTASNYATVTAWSTYDTTRQLVTDSGQPLAFAGGTFDGRFVYFVPTYNSLTRLLRYDTQSTFAADCAWSWVDLSGLFVGDAGGVQPFVGAVFDGQYVYLVPGQPPNPIFARFLARTPPAAPPIPYFNGSFL